MPLVLLIKGNREGRIGSTSANEWDQYKHGRKAYLEKIHNADA